MEFNSKEEADAALMKHGPTNPEVYDAFTRYYERAFSGEIDLGGINPELERQMADALKDIPPAAQDDAPSEVETILKAELGSNFDPVVNDAVAGLGEVFGTAENFQAALDTLKLTPAQQAQGIRWLAEIGRKGRR